MPASAEPATVAQAPFLLPHPAIYGDDTRSQAMQPISPTRRHRQGYP